MIGSIQSGGSSPITAQKHRHRFDKMDKNGDGGLDESELAGMAKRSGKDASAILAGLDANKDGKVDSGEMDAGMARKRGQSGQSQGSAITQFTTSLMNILGQIQGSKKGVETEGEGDMFAKMDANGDGSLDASELGGIAKHTGQDVSKVLSELDTDKDGKVNASELDAGAAKHRAAEDLKFGAAASEFTTALLNIMKQLRDTGNGDAGSDASSSDGSASADGSHCEPGTADGTGKAPGTKDVLAEFQAALKSGFSFSQTTTLEMTTLQGIT